MQAIIWAALTGIIGPEAVLAGERVGVIYDSAQRYGNAARLIAETLTRQGHECLLVSADSSDDDKDREQSDELASFRPTVVATGGNAATALALRTLPDVPIVFFMVPNARDAPFLESPSRNKRVRLCGVTSDVAPEKQVAWIQSTSPRTQRVAILHGPRTTRTVAGLQEAARRRHIDVIPIAATCETFAAAIDQLNAANVDGVLMIPDSDVYRVESVKRLLLWGARCSKPVWTFTGNVVRAGAFAGIEIEPEAVAKRTAELVIQAGRGKPPSNPIVYVDHVQRFVNVHTAKMISVELSQELLAGGVARMGE